MRPLGRLGWLGCGVAVLLFGCTREPEGRFAQEASPEHSATTVPSALRFGPTLADARRPDETIAGLLEVDLPDHGRLDMLVAVVRPGGDPAIELWRFRQATPEEPLVRDGEPVVLLRANATGPSVPELAALRVRMAAPTSAVRRRPAVAAASPSAALEQLGAAARIALDPKAAAQARVDALADVCAGLDDTLLLERDALKLAAPRLADDRWLAREITSASERRATAITRSGETLELLRKGDAWLVAGSRGP